MGDYDVHTNGCLIVGIYTRYHPCLSHDKVFAKLLTSKAVLGKRPLEVQVSVFVQSINKMCCHDDFTQVHCY